MAPSIFAPDTLETCRHGPPVLSEYVKAQGAAMNCDDAYVALPAISVLGAAIRTIHIVSPKNEWHEPSVPLLPLIHSARSSSDQTDCAILMPRARIFVRRLPRVMPRIFAACNWLPRVCLSSRTSTSRSIRSSASP